MKNNQLGLLSVSNLTYFSFASTNFKNCCKTVKLNLDVSFKYRRTFFQQSFKNMRLLEKCDDIRYKKNIFNLNFIDVLMWYINVFSFLRVLLLF